MFRSACFAALALLASPVLAEPVLAETMPTHGAHTSHGATTPSDKAYGAAMNTMMKSMMVKPTGDADRDFVTMMLPHHQGAIDMAKVELRYGKDPVLLAIARAVVDAQEKEIVEMKDWLAKNPK